MVPAGRLEPFRGESFLSPCPVCQSPSILGFSSASSAKLRENAYIFESTTHSLAVDVVLQDRSSIGTRFVSDSNGTFVEILKDTNRNDLGYVDYEELYGVDGVGLANVVSIIKDVEG